MSVDNNQTGDIANVTYELVLSEEEAHMGANRILPRNGKRLQVTIPAGVETGSTVKLSNALQVTDGKGGDILIRIKVKKPEPVGATQGSNEVIVVTDANFSTEVISSELPVVVDFWAEWCGPCRMMSPVIEQAAGLYAGKFKFCKLNVDENPETASQYQAMSIPMLLFFKNGQMTDKSVGAIPLAQLKMKLDSLS
jgi:thioredoxin 1